MSYIHHAFHDTSFMAHRTEYVNGYLVPFSKLRMTLQLIVGIAQFNTVELPRIFEKTSLH